MGKITFERDDYPFEIVLQSLPEATVETEIVVVTLPVYVPGLPQQTARVRMPLSIQQCEHLLDQMDEAVMQANQNSRMRRGW
jgi:hypothetical protein